MAEYNGKAKRIKNSLVALLTGIQYDAGSGPEDAFQQVLGSNYGTFTGWPNVQVLPGHEAVTVVTTHQNDKAPDYIIRVRIALEDTSQSQDAAFEQMYDLSDLMIDAISDADHDSTLNDSEGTLGVYMMNINQGDWAILPTNGGLCLAFDLIVQVTYARDML